MDFSFILLLAIIGTVGISLAYRWWAKAAAAEYPSATAARPPALVEYARAFWPILLFVFVLRAFVVEPFRIPSGSMLPGLYVGDFVLVNKFSYGLRLPILHREMVALGAPRRSDVMVFRYPRQPKLNYIKRVVGLPGDKIVYANKQLRINGEPVAQIADGNFLFTHIAQRGRAAARYVETLDASPYKILNDPRAPARDDEWTVPPAHYFVMGDNRDYSSDSRYWGFVPEENVVGEAFLIWFSWKGLTKGLVRWSRIGRVIY